jgi:hypothetical protein
MSDEMRRRIALLTALVEKAPSRTLGRTAIMKLLYFLITLRRVPLGYHFTLYSYGPFDSTVLEDIDYAARLGALSSRTVMYPSGYGYDIQPGDAAEQAINWAPEFITAREEDIDWVLREFGNMNATELELASTIVYVDQEWRQIGRQGTVRELAEQVNELKPRFAREAIVRRAERLQQRQIVTAVVA